MNDKEKIERGKFVNCYICENMFLRIRQTKRYCNKCENGFCEGEHGSFTGGNIGVCVCCNTKLKAFLKK